MTYQLTEEDVRGLFHIGTYEMGYDDEEAGRGFDEWLAEVKRKSWHEGFRVASVAAHGGTI